MTGRAFIAKIEEITPIEGADRIHSATVLGCNVIVGKDVNVGDVGVFFPEGLQLSEEYAKENNLYRHAHLNKDPEKQSFLEDNRRIRTLTLRGAKSEGLFMPLSSLDCFGKCDLKVGDTFDEINKKKVCEKYIIKMNSAKLGGPKKTKLNLAPYFLPHVDTDQFRYYADTIPAGIITITPKVHGTSGRTAHTLVQKTLPLWKRAINNLIPVFKKEDWGVVTGSRRVVFDGAPRDGFHGSDQFRYDISAALESYIDKGITVYYEVVGSVNGGSIMPAHDVTKLKDKAMTKKYGKQCVYNYTANPGQYEVWVYRITAMGQDGHQRDLTPAQVKAWCKFVPGVKCIYNHTLKEFYYDKTRDSLDKLKDLVEDLTERPDVLTEDYINPKHISEGVVVRVERGLNIPAFYKAKSFAFRAMESLVEVPDPEDNA